MVEIFKTNIDNAEKAAEVKRRLLHVFNEARINFDLEDCDRILRVESDIVEGEKIMLFLKDQGVRAELVQE